MTSFSPARERLSAQAEAALQAALNAAGHLVTSDAIIRAWVTANGGVPAPDAQTVRWHWVFAPALARGRIVRRGKTLFGLSGHSASAVPPPSPPPKNGQHVLERCATAEGVVVRLAREQRRLVGATEVADSWQRVAASKAPAGASKRLARYLEPAIQAGRIRVVRKSRRNYFGPSDEPGFEPPRYASDLQRAEAALGRAIVRMKSAVLLEEIQREIDADPALTLESERLTLANMVSTLSQTGRCKRIRHLARYEDAVRYYSAPGGPWWVSAAAEHVLDRRWRAIMALWKASGGRPFTTHALRLYACSRPGLQIENDPPYAWTNSLHLFHTQESLVRLGRRDSRHVRWAPTREWNALTPELREARLQDGYRAFPGSDDIAAAGNGNAADVGPVDTGFASRNEDMRSLVRLAKAIRGAAEPDKHRRQVLRLRPVCLSDIARAVEHRPEWVHTAGPPLHTCLTEASRLRAGMRKTAIVFIGRVANRAFYDTSGSPASAAFVAFRAALRAASPSRLRRTLRELRNAAELARSGILPLAKAIIDARAAKLLKDLRDRLEALERAAEAAALLSEEVTAVQATLGNLAEIAADINRWAPSGNVDSAAGVVDMHERTRLEFVDSADAFRSIADVAEFRLLTPRLLAWRSPLIGRYYLFPEVLMRTRSSGGTRGRPLELGVDRVSFIAYAASRWAGPRAATYANTALFALGDLRDPEPVIVALEDPTRPSLHPTAAAALGVLDDSGSRDALVRYLIRSVVSDGSYGPGTCVSAAELAAYGLAPLPFAPAATALRAHEQEALEAVAREGADAALRFTARAVLRAWLENWSGEALMSL